MIKVLQGNCLQVLDSLPDEHFHTVITSPPYYGLRDYNTGTWVGGDPKCPHKRLSKIKVIQMTKTCQDLPNLFGTL